MLPVAFQAAPDENVLKFKKANTTLGTAVRELVNSDKYYMDGDLGIKGGGLTAPRYLDLRTDGAHSNIEAVKPLLDSYCANASATKVGAEIVTSDDIVWYQASPATTFGYD